MFGFKKKEDVEEKDLSLANYSRKSRFAEAYRTLRTNIGSSMMEKEIDSLVVTSSVPSEGKTTTVANLGYSFAQSGKKVLVVDADLRRPGLTKMYGVEDEPGLSNIIIDVFGKYLNRGKIDDFGFKDLVILIGIQQRTCILTVRDAGVEIDLYFLKGKLIDLYWKNRPNEKKLASILIREKILSRNEAELALGQQGKSLRKLGSVLLGLGLVDQKELNRILTIQLIETFMVVTEMTNGTFTVNSVYEEDMSFSSLGEGDIKGICEEYLATDSPVSFLRSEIDNIILPTGQENLFLLPAGSVPPNPSELIGSKRISLLFKMLRNQFDIVIIDTSPVLPVSDALLLAPQVDGVVLVLRYGSTNRKHVADAKEQIKSKNARILGVVFNQASVKKGVTSKYYESYYGE